MNKYLCRVQLTSLVYYLQAENEKEAKLIRIKLNPIWLNVSYEKKINMLLLNVSIDDIKSTK